jgi:RNA polymerase sigma factor (TIGR02999 family)
MPLVYDKLRALAGRYMQQEKADHTLQPTALVHEAYLALIKVDRINWHGKTHFYAMAARQMRRALIDHARERGAKKRSGKRVTLKTDIGVAPEQPLRFMAVHEALEKLAARNQRQADVAELRFFGGLHEKEIACALKEIACALGCSERTVRSDWRTGRAWLARALASGKR